MFKFLDIAIARQNDSVIYNALNSDVYGLHNGIAGRGDVIHIRDRAGPEELIGLGRSELHNDIGLVWKIGQYTVSSPVFKT